MERYLNKVFHADARQLLPLIPDLSIDCTLADPMYGISKNPKQFATYDWGPDPAGGDPEKWWDYHRPIYENCRRVLKPNGVLAWAMGCKFHDHFSEWFGGHRLWAFSRYK